MVNSIRPNQTVSVELLKGILEETDLICEQDLVAPPPQSLDTSIR